MKKEQQARPSMSTLQDETENRVNTLVLFPEEKDVSQNGHWIEGIDWMKCHKETIPLACELLGTERVMRGIASGKLVVV
jgi:hypothetical protein